MRVHFGLGETTKIDAVEIHWPSRVVEKVKLRAVDRIYTITEGRGVTDALCGGKPCPASNRASAQVAIKAPRASSAH
jgi:hypothetical protein